MSKQCEFAVNEVYAIDMLISTGDGKSRDMDFRTTIYKREPDQVYQLKMKASRGNKVGVWNKNTNLALAVFSEVEKKFDTMCFNLRALADEKKAKMGINECVNHGLITPFPVLVSLLHLGCEWTARLGLLHIVNSFFNFFRDYCLFQDH